MGGWGGRRKGSGRPRLAEAYGMVRLPAELLDAVDTAVANGHCTSRASFVRQAVAAATAEAQAWAAYWDGEVRKWCAVEVLDPEAFHDATLCGQQITMRIDSANGSVSTMHGVYRVLCADCVAVLAATAKPSTL